MKKIEDFKNSVFRNVMTKIEVKTKKVMVASVLTFAVLGSPNAHALTVLDIPHTVINGLNYVKQTIMEAMEKASWIKQLKEMYDQTKKMADAAQDAWEQVTGMADTAKSVLHDPVGTALANTTGNTTASSYGYAPVDPFKYTPTIDCVESTGVCNSYAYTKLNTDASGVTANDIREGYRSDAIGIKNFVLLSSMFPKTDKLRALEIGELNAREIAEIDAMSREAFARSQNRIAIIEKLQEEIKTPPAGTSKQNTIKRIADLQAKIQGEMGLLQNEENKLTALSIMQQSQRDAHIQRGKELAALQYRKANDTTFYSTAVRTGILTASNALLVGMASAYNTTYSEPPNSTVAAVTNTQIPATVFTNTKTTFATEQALLLAQRQADYVKGQNLATAAAAQAAAQRQAQIASNNSVNGAIANQNATNTGVRAAINADVTRRDLIEGELNNVTTNTNSTASQNMQNEMQNSNLRASLEAQAQQARQQQLQDMQNLANNIGGQVSNQVGTEIGTQVGQAVTTAVMPMVSAAESAAISAAAAATSAAQLVANYPPPAPLPVP